MSHFKVIHPGVLSLIQDSGRVGQAHLGLTTGGAADTEAYYWLNRLLQNSANAVCIEVALGGLKLQCQSDQVICVTGADAALSINGQRKRNWCCHRVKAGDMVELGYAKSGLRAYLGVKHGFDVQPQFGSCSTVPREQIGGLNGKALQVADCLAVSSTDGSDSLLALGDRDIPRYSKELTLRVVLGYQCHHFSDEQQKTFFSSEYSVTKQCDRMGYRLQGETITYSGSSLASEGICYGAIQVPPDGQPIVLLNDRQTLGGYPKIGSVFSLDAAKLTQCAQGVKIRFQAITPEQAVIALNEHQHTHDKVMLKKVNIS